MVSRATGIQNPTAMQVKTWFRDYNDNWIEIFDPEVDGYAESYILIPLGLDLKSYLTAPKEGFQGYAGSQTYDKTDEIMELRRNVVQTLVDFDMIDRYWEEDPGMVRFNIKGFADIKRNWELDKEIPPFGFNFMEGDQYLTIDTLPYCMVGISSASDPAIQVSDWEGYLDQDVDQNMERLCKSGPMGWGADIEHPLYHDDEGGLLMAIYCSGEEVLEAEETSDRLPVFQFWTLENAQDHIQRQTYMGNQALRYNWELDTIWTGNYDQVEALYTDIPLAYRQPAAHHFVLDVENCQQILIPHYRNKLLCVVNRSIHTLSDKVELEMNL